MLRPQLLEEVGATLSDPKQVSVLVTQPHILPSSSHFALLYALLTRTDVVLVLQRGKPISITSIVDIMNLVGKCVIAGA
jgi:predicted transcriptional regulator